jgi:PAS domain S-box-containing protein
MRALAYGRLTGTGRWAALALTLLAGGVCGEGGPPRPPDRKVLVVHSYHEGLAWTDGQNEGIKELFERRSEIELSIEYLDSKRTPYQKISGVFADFFLKKYGETAFDAVIVSDDNALRFVSAMRDSLFAGTPVVFCGVNDYRVELLKEFDGRLTGVVQTLSPSGTLVLIRRLQPELRTLAVVSGTTSTARVIRDQVRSELDGFDGGLQMVWLDGLSTAALKERLAELDESDAVLLCNFNRDADGVYYSHAQGARMISAASGAPVYAMEDHYLGAGVVGGYMNASRDQGREAARLALEILDTGKVPCVNMTSPNRVMFDYSAMRRFGLDRGRLPAGATVIHEPVSFYQQHKNLIIVSAVIIVLLLFALLCAFYGMLQSRLSEKRVRAGEENLRITLDSIGDAVIATDTEGRVVRMNPVARQLTGWDGGDAAGLPLDEVVRIFNARTGKPAENPVEHVLRHGEVVGLANHTELVARNGQRYQIADSAAPIRDADGRITGVVLVFRDVTEDYNIRQALQRSERQYRLFAENSGDLIWTCKGRDQNFAVTYINPAVEQVLGYTVEEYQALPRERRVAPESIRVMDEAVQAMERGISRTIDITHIHKNGALVECELWARPLFDDAGRMSGFQGRTINITERKRTERRLAEINACLVGLGADYDENVNALTALCGRLLNADCAFYNRLLGGRLCALGQWQAPPGFVPENEPEGRLCYDLIQRGDLEPLVVRNLSGSIFARSDPGVFQYAMQTYAGYPASCAGVIVGVLCVFYREDVVPSGEELRILGIIASALATEEDRKRAGEEVRRMQRLEELGTVAGGIAHDFNNLLTGIFGNLELARVNLPEDSPAAPYIGKAFNTIGVARGLTGQFLTFASGGAPALGVVNTAEIVHETVDFNLHGGSVRAEFDIPEDLWSIQADRGQIGQVIANLTVNARQAMPGGGTVGVSACNVPPPQNGGAADAPGAMVRIAICDQGPGIPPEIMERIFDPYFTTRQGGHGLGLSVVQSIVSQHGGRVEVSSTPGGGATFAVFLPALPGGLADGAKTEAAVAAESSGHSRPLHILLMDDEEIIRRIGETLLRHLGYTAETAVDGDEALEKYAAAMRGGCPFDIVIMDLTIRGGKGGEDTIGRVLQLDPAARVIVASGYASDPVMARFSDYGFRGKLAKPYAMEDLRQVIQRVAEE